MLWRSVESVIPDVRKRTKLALVGSPLTHERFLRRPRGTYGATFATVLPDCSTPVDKLVLCGDSVFPGIGVPAVETPRRFVENKARADQHEDS